MTRIDDNLESAARLQADIATLRAAQPSTSSAQSGTARPPTDMSKADRHRSATTLQITSQELFAGAVEVQIEHHGATYRLKHTSLGKLILTK
jgi:hemin uptake protein HemP